MESTAYSSFLYSTNRPQEMSKTQRRCLRPQKKVLDKLLVFNQNKTLCLRRPENVLDANRVSKTQKQCLRPAKGALDMLMDPAALCSKPKLSF